MTYITWTSPIYWTQPGSLPIRNGGGLSFSNIEIFPNPSSDVFNLTFNLNDLSDINIIVSNIFGVTLLTETSNNHIGNYSTAIDLNIYPKGTYFLQIKLNREVFYKKLILN